ncbi:MAG: YIP1 family protein [Nanoarchaeota archaeon]|nr:YIP1 family protein [Nanoarchaeota archaeon]
MTYLSELKKLFFHPKQFFSSVDKDKDYSKIMFFYVKIAIISAILSIIVSLIVLIIQNNLTLLDSISLVINAAIGIGMAFLIPFIIAALVHLGVLIFRGRQGYYNTYKPITYSLVIAAVYGVILTAISAILSMLTPISQVDMTDPTLLLQNKNILISIAITLTILTLSFIHSLVVQVIGVSKFQKMSKIRAFFSIILIPIIIAILVLIIGSYIFSILSASGLP